MFHYMTPKSLILLLICSRFSDQKPFGADFFLKKPLQVPKPFQFLSLFGIYNDKDDQEGLKQAEGYTSESNKPFCNPESLKKLTGTDNKREEETAEANHPKSGISESGNKNSPERKSFIRKPPVLGIQPSSLVDQIKEIFFNALLSFDTSEHKTTNIKSSDKCINPNINQSSHDDSKTLEESEISRNVTNKTNSSENQGSEKDQQFLNFNDTYRNSKISIDKTVSSDPFDRIFYPANNEAHFRSDEILQPPKAYSNETNNNETIPGVDLIKKTSFDLSEELQQPVIIITGSTSNIHIDKFFTGQTNQPTSDSYRMYQEPNISPNETMTFEQLFQRVANQPSLEISKKATEVESSTNKISSNKKLEDFIVYFINQSVPEFEKILQDQEISENRSTNNIFKKSIDSDTNPQLIVFDSSEPNSEFSTNEAANTDQFVQIISEKNLPNSNISKIFRNPEIITNMTLWNDKLDRSNIYQTNQFTTSFKEALNINEFQTEIIQKSDQHDSILLETNQQNINTNSISRNPIVESSTVSKDYVDQNSFHHSNQPTFSEIFEHNEEETDKTVIVDEFDQFNPDSNDPGNDSSNVFINSEGTAKTTVSYDNLHQFTVPQTYRFFFDFDKVFQEPQISTILEVNRDVFTTSYISNLSETTFEFDGEFRLTSDIDIPQTDASNSLENSITPKTSSPRTEFLETFQELEESPVKTADIFSQFINDENIQTTTELDENFQDTFYSTMNAFSDGMFENSINPQSLQTEKLTKPFQELEFHSSVFTTLTSFNLETVQSTFAPNKIFRNMHVPLITENGYIHPNEASETSQGIFQQEKPIEESVYSTADVTGHESHDTTLIPDFNQITVERDTHKLFTTDPIHFTTNFPTKASNTDFKEQNILKNRKPSFDSYNQYQFLYPLCSESSNLKKLTPCDHENKFFMCNDASSGTIKKCKGIRSQNEIPLCFLDLPHGRFLMSCSITPTKMCLYESEAETAVRFCREPEMAICIDERNKLQFCQSRRFKRRELKVSQLDKDEYYAKCAKCKLRVFIDALEDQQPVLKIRSQPYDPDNDGKEDDNDGDSE